MPKIKKAAARVKFYEVEQDILQFWKDRNILQKSIQNRANQPIKTFYDGPITANGLPHHGHMLTFAIKDLFPRYWTMQGYQVTRSLGWDCQGIPVEYEIEKKLGFKEKKDIENYGVAKFNQLCRESVLEYKEAMIELEEKMGRLTDTEEEYQTMDASYIESIWWSLAEIYKKGLLYEGFKVVPYSTRAGTSLSNAEVALGGYKKTADPAVTVKFELVDEPGTFVLAWTTTPWTLPTNFALAVGKDIEYVKVQVASGEKFILAKALVEKVFADQNYQIIQSLTAESLIGKKYKPLFNYFEGRQNCFQIYAGFHVTDDSGTGIVHLAPYGIEDNEIFQQVGIESIDVLDSQGDFVEAIFDLQGVFYKAANKIIITKLEEQNLLLKQESYEHDVAMCWRTGVPLIYKPITSWYIAMSKLRAELLANNETVNWIPAHIKHGRFGNWLSEIKDWGISRLRYWGTPIPVWKSDSGKVLLISSYEELEKYSGVKVTDPHRPFIDDVTFDFEGEKYTRIPDVLDVWYDSGAMPFARFHYPFENLDKFQDKFPAEFIAEGVDQTRGWFYSLMAINTVIFDKSPYKNVVINGFTLDDKGVKVSKSKKNYDAPDTLFENFGADTIRMNYFSTPIVAGEDASITAKTLKTITQEFTLPLWNIYVYLTTYAELFDFEPDRHPNTENILDKWLFDYLNHTTAKVTEELNKYNIQKATFAIRIFLDDLSTWWIRRSRDRFAAGDKVAINNLCQAYLQVMKLLAPFAPFLVEEMYQNLVVPFGVGLESIHLEDYPVAQAYSVEGLEKMNKVRELCSLGLKIRADKGINLRQPLKTAYCNLNDHKLLEILKEELNVQDIKFSEDSDSFKAFKDWAGKLEISFSGAGFVALDIELTQELLEKGKLANLIRNIQNARKNAGLQMGQVVKLIVFSPNPEVQDFVIKFQENICEAVSLSGIKFQKPVDSIENPQKFKVDGEEVLVSFE